MKKEIYEYGENKYEIIIGENAQDNWNIIKQSNDEDIWFHIDDYPSSHVILKINELNTNIKTKIITKQLLKYCGKLCKIHSKYSNVKNLNIIYTKIKYVKLGKNVGEVYTSNTKTIIIK